MCSEIYYILLDLETFRNIQINKKYAKYTKFTYRKVQDLYGRNALQKKIKKISNNYTS